MDRKKMLSARGNELLDLCESEHRALNEEERTEVFAILGELESGPLHDALDKRTHNPVDNGAEARYFESITGGMSQATSANPRAYRSLFPSASHNETAGFKSFRDFVRVLTSGRFDPRLEERVMLEGVPGLGGFAVPVQFIAEILDGGLEAEVMRPRASVYPMTSDTLQVPAWNGADHTSSLYGGITGSWLNENAAATPVDAALRRIELHAYKLACYVNVSREMMQDGLQGGFQNSLEGAMIRALGFFLDDAFLTGDGAGKPLGVIAAPSTITQTAEVGQAVDTIVFQNIAKMWARLLPLCQTRAIWAANPSTIPSLYSMSLAVGTGGVSVFQPASGGASSTPYSTLFGRPIIFTEKLPALGDLGDIICLDPQLYKIGLRQEVTLDMSNAVGWLNDYISLRVTLRADGQPEMDKAITPHHGTSQSWAVMLAAR